MAILIPELTVDLATATGQQVFEVVLTNWGNAGAGADTTSNEYPASTVAPLPSIYAAAVGPLSTVNRFNVAYNPQVQGVFTEGGAVYRRAVDLLDPLTYPTAAGTVPGGTTTVRINSNIGSVANVFRAFSFGDTYVKTDGTISPFGTALPVETWISPTLHVLLYLQPPTISPPIKRPPMILHREQAAIADAAEHLHTVCTIAGRRKVRVNFTSTGTLTATGRVTVIANEPPGVAAGREILVATVAGIAPTASQAVDINDPGADFLLIYYTQTAGAGFVIIDLYGIDGP
jgi:hypothetical protein